MIKPVGCQTDGYRGYLQALSDFDIKRVTAPKMRSDKLPNFFKKSGIWTNLNRINSHLIAKKI
ncbi:hypothetical protein AB0758_18545 [Tolypothrix bouteillei VB521301_2]